MKIVLTGKSGVGKSTALKYIKKLGINTLDMDKFMHSSYKKGQPGFLAIKKVFGSEYLTKSQVNRKKLANFVFSNKKAFEKLKKATIPIAKKKIVSLKGNWVVEMAAYINNEAYWKKHFDEVFLIVATEEKNLKNLHKKMKSVDKFSTTSVEKYKNLIKSNKIKAKYIVENSGNLKEFKDKIHTQILKIFNLKK